MALTYVVSSKAALDRIHTKIAQNFTRLFADLRGFLLTEHHEDGTHAAITADSVTITPRDATTDDAGATGDLAVGGDQTIEGSITSPDYKIGAGIGEIAGGSSTVGVGLDLDRRPTVRNFSVVTGADALGNHLGFYDLTGGVEVLKLYKLSTNEYLLAKDGNQPSALPFYIGGGDGVTGHDTDNMPDEIAGILLYAHQGITEYSRTVKQGVGTNIAFAAANFTASSGNWTLAAGDQAQYRYRQIGALVFVSFNFATTSVSATPTELRAAVPITPVSGGIFFCDIGDNGTRRVGICNASPSGYIQIQRADGGALAVAANTTAARGSLWYEI